MNDSNWIIKCLICWLGFFLPLPAAAVHTSQVPHVIRYELDVGFFPEARMDYAGLIEVLEGSRPDWNKEDSERIYPHMKGEAVLTCQLGDNPLTSFHFYLHAELRVHRVKLAGQSLKFSQQSVFYPANYTLVANKITVALDEMNGTHTFSVSYGGLFNPSCAASPSNYMRIDSEGAYLRGYGYSLWFPILLEAGADSRQADFTRVRIHTPKTYSAVFTGEKMSENVEGDRRVSEWQGQAINLRDTQITVRPFVVEKNQEIYLYYLDHPASEAASRDISLFTTKVLSFYTDHYMRAQIPQLHIAELPNFASGISSGNMVGITSGQWRRFNLTDQNAGLQILLAHELVHPFTQPKISEKSPLAALFIEGMPAFFHLPALAEILGEDWYRDTMKRIETAYLIRKKTGKTSWGALLPREKPILALTRDDIPSYKDRFILNDRVALFFNYLRSRMGTEVFGQFTRQLCSSHQLTPGAFTALIEQFLPGSSEDLHTWLMTSEFPQHFRVE